jgi:hypothetical protein
MQEVTRKVMNQNIVFVRKYEERFNLEVKKHNKTEITNTFAVLGNLMMKRI